MYCMLHANTFVLPNTEHNFMLKVLDSIKAYFSRLFMQSSYTTLSSSVTKMVLAAQYLNVSQKWVT